MIRKKEAYLESAAGGYAHCFLVGDGPLPKELKDLQVNTEIGRKMAAGVKRWVLTDSYYNGCPIYRLEKEGEGQ